MSLYDATGTIIDTGGSSATVDLSLSGSKLTVNDEEKNTVSIAYQRPSARSNIVHTTAYDSSASTTVRWHSTGLLFRNPDLKTSFEMTFSVDVDGESCTAFSANLNGVSVDYSYSGSEESYTTTFSNATKLNSEYLYFYTSFATHINTDYSARLASGRTLRIASLPEGLELIGTYNYETPTLTTNSLTFDSEEYFDKYNSRWSGKYYVPMGDSITAAAQGYAKVASEILQTGYFRNLGAGGTSAVQLAAGINTKLYQGADLITIAHGVNDFDNSPNSPIGEVTSDTSNIDATTYIGALQTIINTIQTNSPNSEIVLITPIYNTGEYTRNSEGKLLSDYRTAMKAVATYYGFPVIEGNKIITADNASQYLADGTHPNQAGYNYYGRAVAAILANLV